MGDTPQTYADIPGINWSTLKYMAISPRMYRYRLSNPEPRKPAWVLGTAVHCAILEPDVFDDRYIALTADLVRDVAPPRSTKAGKAIVAEHPEWNVETMAPAEYQAACVKRAFPGKLALSETQRQTVLSIATAVREHRVARDLLRGGLAEEVVTWTDERTGLLCKGRLDYLRPDLLIDLKSTRNPAPSKFERDAANFGYVAQVALYHDGAVAARRLDGKERPYIIAPRTTDDFDVAVYQLTAEALDRGRAIYRSLLQRLVQCTEADYWPGVAPELLPLSLPEWATGEIIAEEGTF